MRAVIQRVSQASVKVDNQITGKIQQGLLILLGVGKEDTAADTEWLIRKITQMRIFSDEQGKMNCSIRDIGGQFLVVSQFTLLASTKKGNRPSFIHSAGPELANKTYEQFVEQLAMFSNLPCKTGIFGANMQVELVNDGPVTIVIDSKVRE